MHIAIIGAGINGLLTALELIESGCHVSIFDQYNAGEQASWAGGGILSPMYPWRYVEEVNALAQLGKAMYETWNQKLQPITKIDFEIQHSGMLIFDQSDFEIGQAYAEQFQYPMQYCERLTASKLQQLNPQVSPKFSEALHFPHLSHIRNPRVLKSLMLYLKQHPRISFYENTPIDHIQISNGKVQSIQSRGSQIYKANHIVLTTGAWSQILGKKVNLDIPVQPVHGQMLLFKTPENWLSTMCMNKVMYLIPRKDGHVVCGSSMNDFGFDCSTKAHIEQDIFQAATEMVPKLAQFPIIKQWAGLRPSSPTGVPYIGQMPEIDNLWANFGHFRNGLCMAPASALLLKQLLLKQNTFINPTHYSPQRLILTD